MSVLIKGMKLPKEGCKDCPLVKRGHVFDICPFLKREVNGNVERGGKPYDCPLIELSDAESEIDKWWERSGTINAERSFNPVMPITNADSIRAMSDDELASWIADIAMCNNCRAKNMDASKPCKGLYDGCKGNWLDWLKQEAERSEE